MNSWSLTLIVAISGVGLIEGAAAAEEFGRRDVASPIGVRPNGIPVTALTHRPDGDIEARPVAWGRRSYRPYAGYYYPGPRYYDPGYRGYYRPYYGGYRGYNYGPGYRYYDYPYGTARAGPLRFYWR